MRNSADRIAFHVPSSVMGINFFGPEEWFRFYGVDFPKTLEIPAFPWAIDTLNAPCPFVKGRRVKDTHFAFLGLPMLLGQPLTIARWSEIHPVNGRIALNVSTYLLNERFASKHTCEYRWYLTPLVSPPTLDDRTYNEQVEMLLPTYELSSAIVELTKHILYFRRTGLPIKPPHWARCGDIYTNEYRVVVGCDRLINYDGSHQYWPAVGVFLDKFRSWNVGVALSRKPHIA